MFTSIFNNCITGFAIAHASYYGIFESLMKCDEMSIGDINLETGCAITILEEIFKNLSNAQIIKMNHNTISPSIHFVEAVENAGYFEWLLIGYGALLSTPKEKKPLMSQLRNGSAIANGSRKIGEYHVDPILIPFILGKQSNSIIDLGCGSAQRIIKLAKEKPSLIAVGVDSDQNAVALAQEAVQKNELGDRVSIFCEDVSNCGIMRFQYLKHHTVLMAFMGHDMWPYDSAFIAFAQFRKYFSDCDSFIMCDTVKSVDCNDIFSGGFEFSHALMYKYIPTIAEWKALFIDTGWSLKTILPLNVPNTYIFELTPC